MKVVWKPRRVGPCPTTRYLDKASPANEFAGYPCEVHLRGLEVQSTKVDSAKSSARLQSQRGLSSSGFTLIELLVVIAVILIMLAGEVSVTRQLLRSTNLARDFEAASSILSTELAELRNRGLSQTEGTLPFPIPPEHLSQIPVEAQGEFQLEPRDEGKIVEVRARLRWKSVDTQRDLTLTTLMRPSEERTP